jgi:hypothetical protein
LLKEGSFASTSHATDPNEAHGAALFDVTNNTVYILVLAHNVWWQRQFSAYWWKQTEDTTIPGNFPLELISMTLRLGGGAANPVVEEKIPGATKEMYFPSLILILDHI